MRADEAIIAQGIDIITRLHTLNAAPAHGPPFSTAAPALDDNTIIPPAAGFSHFQNELFGSEDSRHEDFALLPAAALPSPLQQQVGGSLGPEPSWGPFVSAAEDEVSPEFSPVLAVRCNSLFDASAAAGQDLDRPATPECIVPPAAAATEENFCCAHSDVYEDKNAAVTMPAPLRCASPIADKTGKKLFTASVPFSGGKRRGSSSGVASLRASSEPPCADSSSATATASRASLANTFRRSLSHDGGSGIPRLGRSFGSASSSLRSSFDSASEAAKKAGPGAGPHISRGGENAPPSGQRPVSLVRSSLPLGPSSYLNVAYSKAPQGGEKTNNSGGVKGQGFGSSGGKAAAATSKQAKAALVSAGLGGGAGAHLGSGAGAAKARVQTLGRPAGENAPPSRTRGMR